MFLGYIHYFRALAIVFIVGGHCISAFDWGDRVDTERLLRIYISNGTTLFVFIAGYLFQHLSDKYETARFFKAKIRNVIVPYTLISIPAIMVFTTILEREYVPPGFYDAPFHEQVAMFYLTGTHLAPLWFIPMIALFYLAAPLLIKADKIRTFYLLIPLFMVASFFFDRGSPMESFVHYFSVYVLGMALSRYKDEVNPIISRTALLSISLIIVVTLGLAEFYLTDGTMGYLNYLKKVVLAIFFLGILVRYNAHLKSKVVGVIADASFGIFFIHSYFISSKKIAYAYIFEDLPEGNLLLFVLFTFTILSLCVAFVLAVKKIIGKKSRFLLGS